MLDFPRTRTKESSYERLAILLVASAALCTPALAEEIGVGVGPVGVTVGSGPDRVVREREVVRERDHRDGDKTVIIKKDRPDREVIEKKTIIER